MKTNLLLFIVLITQFINFGAVAQIPERAGWWKFDDPTNLLKAEVGAPLELVGAQESVDGPIAGNKATKIDMGNYLILTHGMAANGGGSTVNEYSLQIDFSVPEIGLWHAFLQTDITNGGDADLFTNTNNAIGISEAGYSSKGIAANTWYRMILTVKNGEFFKVYMDGVLWLDATGRTVDDRFGLLKSILLFADNDGEDAAILCSEIGIWNTALQPSQVELLGGATGERVPQRTKIGWWKFDEPANMLKAEIGKPLELVGTQQSVNGPVADNKATKIGAGSYLKLTHGVIPVGAGTNMNEYSIQMDFSVPEIGVWHSFFQTDAANASDAELLINKIGGTIGNSTTNYSALGVAANTWYRLVVSAKNGEFFKVYINGELWLDAAGQDVDGRFSLSDVLLLFADDDGGDGTILCSEVALWEVALNDAEIAELGTSPTVEMPERLGWWKFDDPKNMFKGEIGYDLGETGTIQSVSGPALGNNAVQVALGSYLTMTHGIYGNGGGFLINDYTLQIDFSVPEVGIWHAFFQTSMDNGSDADLFTNKSNAIGTAATTYTTKTITAATWYRMVITVRNGSFFRVYMNGELWLDAAGQPLDGRFALSEKLLLFADDDGDDGLINCSEVVIWDVALNAEQVAKLGEPTTPVTTIDETNSDLSDLGQNYPNPFTYSTTIPYQIRETGYVNFRVLDITGKEIQVINEGVKSAGKYNLELNSATLNNGIYYIQMTTNRGTSTRKMVVVQ